MFVFFGGFSFRFFDSRFFGYSCVFFLPSSSLSMLHRLPMWFMACRYGSLEGVQDWQDRVVPRLWTVGTVPRNGRTSVSDVSGPRAPSQKPVQGTDPRTGSFGQVSPSNQIFFNIQFAFSMSESWVPLTPSRAGDVEMYVVTTCRQFFGLHMHVVQSLRLEDHEARPDAPFFPQQAWPESPWCLTSLNEADFETRGTSEAIVERHVDEKFWVPPLLSDGLRVWAHNENRHHSDQHQK